MKALDDSLSKWERIYGAENRSDIPGIRFADDPRKLFIIGVRFSTENRCIDDWKIAG